MAQVLQRLRRGGSEMTWVLATVTFFLGYALGEIGARERYEKELAEQLRKARLDAISASPTKDDQTLQ